MNEIIKILISLFPVFIFLGTLIYFDNFRLVKFGSVLIAILIGCFAAVISLLINNWFITKYSPDIIYYSRYVAPLIEEFFKASFIIFLFTRRKTGFLVNSAINGFAVGAGFALIENIYYLHSIESSNLLLWALRGFGTALMHGGTTTIFAIISKYYFDRYITNKYFIFIPGLLAAFILHSLFNHFVLPPHITTLLQLITVPALIALVYNRSELLLRNWLEIGLDTNVKILEYVNNGIISQTNIGRYLDILKINYSGEILADMLCLIKIHTELAVRAKGILMMREAGFQIIPDSEIREKIEELNYLKKTLEKQAYFQYHQ